MFVQVKNKLTKTKKPDKRIIGRSGPVRQQLDDGYWLVEFGSFCWYIHVDDLIEL